MSLPTRSTSAPEDCWVDRRPCWRRHRRCGVLGRPCWRCHRRCVDPGRPCWRHQRRCGVLGRLCWSHHRRCGVLGRPCWRCHHRCVVPGRLAGDVTSWCNVGKVTCCEYEDLSYVGRYDDIYDVQFEDRPGYCEPYRQPAGVVTASVTSLTLLQSSPPVWHYR